MAKLASTTYGDALFQLAVEESKVDSLYEEVKFTLDTFKNDSELVKFLNHPKVNKEEKEAFLESTFGGFVSRNLTGLLTIMVSKDRQDNIIDTLKYFCDKVLEYKKIGTAYVTTAIELDERQKSELVSKLLATTKYESFNMIYVIDESIIGGMIIRIGDRVVDSSIKTKLDELARELKKVQLS